LYVFRPLLYRKIIWYAKTLEILFCVQHLI
jgi:hypothetical protein